MKSMLAALAIAPAAAIAAGGPQITIYNDGFATVKEDRALAIADGVSEIRVADMSRMLEPDSVMLRERSKEPFGLRVLEQSFVNDPLSEGLLLYQMEGKTLRFEEKREDGTVKEHVGKLVRSGYVPGAGATEQPIVEIDGIRASSNTAGGMRCAGGSGAGKVNIQDFHFVRNNGHGLHVTCADGGGLPVSVDVDARGGTVHSNTGDGVLMRTSGGGGAGKATFKDFSLYRNGGSGIDMNCPASIEQCDSSNNGSAGVRYVHTRTGHVTLMKRVIAGSNDAGGILVSSDDDDTTLALRIEESVCASNSGPGIAEEDLERVFEEFAQAEYLSSAVQHGTGLGLAISRHLARMLGGTLTVTSRVGHGSTFTLLLPEYPELSDAEREYLQ